MSGQRLVAAEPAVEDAPELSLRPLTLSEFVGQPALRENLGVLRRETVAEEIKSLDQNARAQLRKYGVRFGAFNIYFPILLKPAAAELILTLWSLKNAGAHGLSAETLPEAPRAGLTSFAPDPACQLPLVCG